MGYSINTYYPPASYWESPERIEEYKQTIAKQIRELIIN